MSTYCIGDVHGCFDKLKELLEIIDYDYTNDNLWFVGDLVNRGFQSLEVLRFIKKLKNTKIVLGNHDLHLINYYNGIVNFASSRLKSFLTVNDGQELINWLRSQSIFYYNSEHKCILAHAGIYPGWDLQQAQFYAHEVESVLHGSKYYDFLKQMYGDLPNVWDNSLKGYDRLRFIVNAFTRMRFCHISGSLNFKFSGGLKSAPQEYYPWFKIPWRKNIPNNTKILFGHWAALDGISTELNVEALDTGCVYGKFLTAIRIEDGRRFKTKPYQIK